MKKRKIGKTVWMPLAFLIYSSAIYIYWIPRSTASTLAIVVTVGVNLLIIVALWWLLRKKEDMAARREQDQRDCKAGKRLR